MVENDENNVLIYESNEKGERVLVKSVESTQSVYIRFINRTSRPVDVWWRDFQGNRRHYARLESRAFYNIDTYVTHPWEFTDPATTENYRINNKKIFRPPRSLAGVRHRTNWLISVSVRTLRHSVMMAVAQHVNDVAKVQALGLPRELERDLERLIDAIQHTPDPPPRT